MTQISGTDWTAQLNQEISFLKSRGKNLQYIVLSNHNARKQTLAMPSIWSNKEIMCRRVTDRYHNWCNCLLRALRHFFASAKSCFKTATLSVDSLNSFKIWRKTSNRKNENHKEGSISNLLLPKFFRKRQKQREILIIKEEISKTKDNKLKW